MWSSFSGGVQHLQSPGKHLSLLQQHLKVKTMIMAKTNAEIPNVSGFLVPGNQCALDPSVFAFTESKQVMLGPKSVMVIYWAPSSASWALLDMCPATSAPAPIRRPAPTSFVPVFNVPSIVFLPFFGESFLDSLRRMNLIFKLESTPRPLEGSDFLFLKCLDATCVDDRDDG